MLVVSLDGSTGFEAARTHSASSNNRKWALKQFWKSVVQALVGGFLFLIPIYLATLLLLKAMKSLGRVVRPLARLLPESFPAETVFSLLIVLMLCFLVGIVLRTPFGKVRRTTIENSLLRKIPGYDVIRSMTQQLAGQGEENAWQPALAEIENALVPAFIVEELDDGRFTVFVPSVPTLLAGAIYILTAERVHPLNVPLKKMVKTITRWGSGSKELVDAMQPYRSAIDAARSIRR
jgi:uncharacterized membrane protein